MRGGWHSQECQPPHNFVRKQTKGNTMNNETTTATARTKSQLRYAIKTKVFTTDATALLRTALGISGDWHTFKKSDFMYKQLGYVAGADFNLKTGEFHLVLRQNGSIERRGGHTNWQRIH